MGDAAQCLPVIVCDVVAVDEAADCLVVRRHVACAAAHLLLGAGDLHNKPATSPCCNPRPDETLAAP